jgi:hypothetical protein
MILCMRWAWENGWESRVGGNNGVVCSWVGGLGEHQNRSAFAMVGVFGKCQHCPRTGRDCWRAGWVEHLKVKIIQVHVPRHS